MTMILPKPPPADKPSEPGVYFWDRAVHPLTMAMVNSDQLLVFADNKGIVVFTMLLA